MELRDLAIQHYKACYDLENGDEAALARINELTNKITEEVDSLVKMTQILNEKYSEELEEIDGCYEGSFDTEIKTGFILGER